MFLCLCLCLRLKACVRVYVCVCVCHGVLVCVCARVLICVYIDTCTCIFNFVRASKFCGRATARGKESKKNIHFRVRTSRITAENVTNQPLRTVWLVALFVRATEHCSLLGEQGSTRLWQGRPGAPAPHFLHHAERIFSGLDRALTAPHSMHRQPA